MIQPQEKIGHYTVLDKITEGTFATVYLLEDKNKMLFAGKMISRKDMEERRFVECIEQEIRVHSMLHHPYITELKEVVYTPDYIVIITDYYSTDLCTSILENPAIAVKLAPRIMEQLLECVAYLEKLNIVHCDIKPENILLDSIGNVKLCDFGSCENVKLLKRSQSGTVSYMPPEAHANNLVDFMKWDVWSIGVVVYACLTGQIPWNASSPEVMKNEILHKKVNIPNITNEIVNEVLSKCLIKNPDQRPLASELLKSIYMKRSHILRYASADETNNVTKQRIRAPPKKHHKIIIRPKSIVHFTFTPKILP